LAIIQSVTPVLVLLVSSIWFFNGRYKKYRPSFTYIEFGKAADLLSLGIKFFILNIAFLLLYQTNTFVIAQLFGPEEVTSYNVAFAYYSVLTMGFGIILTPFWSAFTEAWLKKEVPWIKMIMKYLVYFWLFFVFCGIIMVVFSKWIFSIWIGDNVHVPYIWSIIMCSWILIYLFNGIFCHFINGVGKIKLQMYLGISVALLNIPLAFILGSILGLVGILLANVVLALIQTIIYPIQYKRILQNKAVGVWNE
jgi:O-antigen/teichoic acid export membrane protein